MSKVPTDFKYTQTHEWAILTDDGSVRIGITDHAQHLLGDMVFVELPAVDTMLDSGTECAVVESVKSAVDVYSPVSGEVIAVNEQVVESPELLNKDPYGGGWLWEVQPQDPSELDHLLDAETYSQQIADQED